ncbi:PPOX class F420-dependent oxidoreductase [Halostreptopolyspora alba]|uniref:PPOX class F420-dependent oxidoreductase n=1 Tax=Halostreptopolyspora alba TaxID=2487137 RepID=A0A3N0EDA9_9ACTN|nr:PPOX class F420-dependent oxidoreductase [Nocardiopsaceae bacterium YIM 96095]
MSVFTTAELDYLGEQLLGRFATSDARGRPQVRPVGFFYDADTDGIVIGGAAGSGMAGSAKFRNAAARPDVSLVVDDVETTNGWEPRGVEIRGVAEAHIEGGEKLGRRLGAPFRFEPAWILVRPRRVLTWGVEGGAFDLDARDVA